MYSKGKITGKKYDCVFILPDIPFTYPSGGFNIVYQLSRGITDRGKKVCIAYMEFWKFYLLLKFNDSENRVEIPPYEKILVPLISKVRGLFISSIKTLQKVVGYVLNIDYDYSILKGIDQYFVLGLNDILKLEASKIIATGWQTAFLACDYIESTNAEGYYLIQNSEDDPSFSGKFSKYASMSYETGPLKKIVLNENLFRRFENEVPMKISVGIDAQMFHSKENADMERATSVLFVLRTNPSKGAEYAIKAMERLKNEVKNVKIFAYGNMNKSAVPEYVHYYRTPTNEILVDLYNKTSIFVLPSIVEGMPVPPLEAMSCGNAVVVTDNGGVNEYITHEKNGLIVPVRDPDAIAESVKRIISDSELRTRLVINGRYTAHQYTYDEMVDQFVRNVFK